MAGSVLGATAMSVLLWVAAIPLRAHFSQVLGFGLVTLLVIALVRDLIWRFPFPQRRVQVIQEARDTLPPTVTSFVYGSYLGAGLLTFIAFSSLPIFYATIILAHSPTLVLTAAAGFGVGRALMPFLIAWRWPRPEQSLQVVKTMDKHRKLAATASWIGAAGVLLALRE